ncbi:MAG TPA: nitroreductase family protein [Candidatus Binatia bacterium]|nr:nitroreductase family protein [Candidatus Binatia bacterium]
MDVASIDLASVDHVLGTTRAVRKRLDLRRPVEPEILEHCIEIATQAPTGLYGETWHFVVVTEPEKRAAIAALIKKTAEGIFSGTLSFDPYLARLHAVSAEDPRFALQQRMYASGMYLINHLHEVPVLVLSCIEGRVETAGPGAQASLYGSILPATWSLMLALRARGLGSVLITGHIQHYEREVAKILDIPHDITQAALVPVAYFTGADFKPAKRVPAQQRTHWNRWG